jgi:hypothetical protein
MGTSLVNATNINIGTTGKSTTTINGTLTSTGTQTNTGLINANGGLTIGGAYGISLTTSTGYTPSSTQLGGITNVLTGVGTYSIGTINTATQITTFSMPVGTYIVYWSGLCTSASTYYTMGLNLGSPSITQKYSCAVLCNNAAVSNANPKINMSAIVQNSVSEQWYLSHQASVIGTNYVSNVFLYYVRIA